MARSKRKPTRRGASTARAKPAPGGGASWLSFVSGVLVGAVTVWVYMVYRPGITIPAPWAPGAENAALETPAPASSTEPANNGEPDFTFYNILPDREVRVHDWELGAEARAQDGASKHAPRVDYVVQAGSFKQRTEADELKAQLALNGIRSNIERVVINGQDVWFRVHLGPFSEREVLADTRARLNRLGIKHIVLKKAQPQG